MTHTDTVNTQRRAERAARLRGIRFLAEHAIAAGDAYAFHVGPRGHVNIQGEPGSLQGLVGLLGAEPRPVDPQEPMREWVADVAYDGDTVHVELTEMGQ